jgi:predicted DNA-binding ribbon-helix-helix protein
MSQFALRLPNSLHERVRAMAREDNVSLNQFITMAVAEKVSELETTAFFRERAVRGNLTQLQSILDRVPDVAPLAGDEKN